MSHQLSARKNETQRILSQSNPEALTQFSTYMTAFGYTKNARIIDSVASTAEASQSINQAYASADALKKKISEIYGQDK